MNTIQLPKDIWGIIVESTESNDLLNVIQLNKTFYEIAKKEVEKRKLKKCIMNNAKYCKTNHKLYNISDGTKVGFERRIIIVPFKYKNYEFNTKTLNEPWRKNGRKKKINIKK